MEDSAVSRTEKGGFFPSRGFWWHAALGVIVAGALLVRLYDIAYPPASFHPTRQYRAALIARAFYVNHDLASARIEGLLEPPLAEGMAAGLYKILGQESLAAARAMSIVWWMLAAMFLYLLAERAISRDGAVVAVLFFLFLPFSVMASRSFQPDPLMMMFFVGSAWSIFRLRETPTGRWQAAAISLSALAIFTKPVCLFPIWLAFLTTGVARDGFRATLKNVWTWLYFGLGFLPSLLYYGYGLFVADFLRWQADASFVPGLLFTPSFWRDWVRLAVEVVGGTAIVVALLGMPLARLRSTKALLVGLWAGYVVMGLVFTFHIHTHNYYQMPLIPIVALSLGASVGFVLERLASLNVACRAALTAALVAGVVLTADATCKELRRDKGGDAWAALAKEIGNRVGHSWKTVFVAPDYGHSLMYYGGVAGTRWPYAYERRFPPEKIEENLAQMIAERSPRYFIMAEMLEFQQQPNLERALAKYPVVFATDNCRVYDLTRVRAVEKVSDERNRKPTGGRGS